MQRDTIVYFGIIQYDYNNAMCQHAAGIEKLITAIGFKPVVIGVSPNIKRGSHKRISKNVFVINEPQSIKERLVECISASEIKDVLREIGCDRIKTFIMADFRYFPMKQMEAFCRSNHINYAVDIMDFFVDNGSIVSKIKKIDCDIRIKHFYPKIERRIYICSSYLQLLGEGFHTAIIPGVTWENGNLNNRTSSKIRLSFLGQPGAKCEKEKIDWVIKGIFELGLSDKYDVWLAGFKKEELEDNNPELVPFISECIHFCGRLSKEECSDLLNNSDFSLVIRPDTTLSRYGFSTKIGEALSHGVPILATDTSDNKQYIKDGYNGFVCGCSYKEVKQLLLKVSKLTDKDISEMKNNCMANNPLQYTNYVKQFSKVVVAE